MTKIMRLTKQVAVIPEIPPMKKFLAWEANDILGGVALLSADIYMIPFIYYTNL